MPPCCSVLEDQFGEKVVEAELRRYRKKGLLDTTRTLVDGLVDAGVEGADLLDIGGGLGGVQLGLLSAGADRAVAIEASSAFVSTARELAREDGHLDRIDYRIGDFTELVDDLEPTDIVTLDRVICCYPDMQRMVTLSASKARRLYGVVYPRDSRLVRWGVGLMNLMRRIRGADFRVHVHPVPAIDRAIRAQGYRRRFHRTTLVWEVAVYAR